jgi:GT2 family glycosyltransferase
MISVVIPSYNRCESILALLADIQRQDFKEFEVIVVDDCSSDNSVSEIRRLFPATKLLTNRVNGGPAVSRNRGIRAAENDIVVGLDSDAGISDPRLFARIIETADNFRSVGIFALRILRPDGKADDVPRWWHPLSIEEFADKRFYTSYFSGTGYVIRKSEALAAGLFPEVFYMHYEEVELAYRILNNNGNILYCPDIKVLHHEAPTVGRSKVQTFFKPRNQILLAFKSFPVWRAFLYLIPRVLFQAFAGIRSGHLGSLLNAIQSGISIADKTPGLRDPLRPSTFRRIKALRRSLGAN